MKNISLESLAEGVGEGDKEALGMAIMLKTIALLPKGTNCISLISVDNGDEENTIKIVGNVPSSNVFEYFEMFVKHLNEVKDMHQSAPAKPGDTIQ